MSIELECESVPAGTTKWRKAFDSAKALRKWLTDVGLKHKFNPVHELHSATEEVDGLRYHVYERNTA